MLHVVPLSHWMVQDNHCFEPEHLVTALFGLSYPRFVLAKAREGSAASKPKRAALRHAAIHQFEIAVPLNGILRFCPNQDINGGKKIEAAVLRCQNLNCMRLLIERGLTKHSESN